jgi:hypothetical protein
MTIETPFALEPAEVQEGASRTVLFAVIEYLHDDSGTATELRPFSPLESDLDDRVLRVSAHLVFDRVNLSRGQAIIYLALVSSDA